MKPTALALIASLVSTTQAQAFQAQNKMNVQELGASGFVVAYKGGRAGVSDFWCAAGDYVVRGLGRDGTTRIYRTTSVPRRPGAGIEFSLSAENAKSTGLVSLFPRDRFVPAAVARNFCNLQRNR